MYHLAQTEPFEIKEIAVCHILCFPNSLSSKLGVHYVAKSYEWFLAADNRFLMHVTDGKSIIGYCGGFIPQHKGDGSVSGMMQYAMKEAATGMLRKAWLFFNKDIIGFYPLIFKNIFKVFFKKKTKKAQADFSNEIIENKTGLVVIGVHPAYRGKGVFEILMASFEKKATELDTNKITLSVKNNNERAINAYKKVGWRVSQQTEKELKMFKMINPGNA